MRLVTYKHRTGPRPAVALDPETLLDLLEVEPGLPGRWNQLFAHLERVRELVKRARDDRRGLGGALVALKDLELLPPVPEPSKIVAVGMNYRDHALEQNKPLPENPLLFAKAPSCLQAPHGPILLDADLDRVDAEAELAVVIGRAGRAVTPVQARELIAGYMCFNDVSDRAAQYSDKQWFRGKSIDTGGPCGPWIVTPDELPELARGLAISARWNGRTMQSSNTEQLIFAVDELISYASRHMTFVPGDIIATGTPGGVGVFREPQVFLKPGDLVEVEIEGIGAISNPVRAR